MGCLENSLGVIVYQGEDKNLTYHISDKSSGDSFDLTGATEIQVLFPKADGTALIKSLTGGDITIVNAGGGKFSCHLGPTDTSDLLVGNQLSLEVHITIGGFLTVVQIQNALSVVASLFP